MSIISSAILAFYVTLVFKSIEKTEANRKFFSSPVNVFLLLRGFSLQTQ